MQAYRQRVQSKDGWNVTRKRSNIEWSAMVCGPQTRPTNLRRNTILQREGKHHLTPYITPSHCMSHSYTPHEPRQTAAPTSALERVHAEMRHAVAGGQQLLVLCLAVPTGVEAPRPVKNRKTQAFSEEKRRTQGLTGFKTAMHPTSKR